MKKQTVFGTALALWMGEIDSSPGALGEAVGRSYQNVRDILDGKSQPNARFVTAVIEAHGLAKSQWAATFMLAWLCDQLGLEAVRLTGILEHSQLVEMLSQPKRPP